MQPPRVHHRPAPHRRPASIRRRPRDLAPLGLALGVAVLSLLGGASTAAGEETAFPRPETLVAVGLAFPELGRELSFFEALGMPEIVAVREEVPSLERLAAFDLGRRQVRSDEAADRLFTAFWWADPLATLEVDARLGRSFTPQELTDRAAVAVLSERAWQRLFDADPGAIGARIQIETPRGGGRTEPVPHVVIGVLPAGVSVYDTDLWLPGWAPEKALERDRRQFQVLARIAADRDLEEVGAELERLARAVEAQHADDNPEYRGWSLRAAPWSEVEPLRRRFP